PVHVLRSIDAVQHRKTNFPVSVRFYVGDAKSFANFFCHVVPPSHPQCSGNNRVRDRANERNNRENYNKNSPHRKTLGDNLQRSTCNSPASVRLLRLRSRYGSRRDRLGPRLPICRNLATLVNVFFKYRLIARVFALILCALSAGSALPEEKPKPNRHVVVVVWDGMRPDFISEKNTPVLWKFAHEGVIFR